jgi:hypothetical protein
VTDVIKHKIVRDARGEITEFPVPSKTVGVIQGIAAGPDGAIWFTSREENMIRRMSPTGRFEGEFRIPSTSSDKFASNGSWPRVIAAGPDGNLWFAEMAANKIARITAKGEITEFAIPTADSKPYCVATGPDQAVWFTESGADKIGRLDPKSGAIAEYPLPSPKSFPRENRRRLRREPLVHGELREPDRTDHPEGTDRGVRGPDAREPAARDRGGPRRRGLVHRVQGEQDRPHRARREDLRVRDADEERAAVLHRRGARREHLVHAAGEPRGTAEPEEVAGIRRRGCGSGRLRSRRAPAAPGSGTSSMPFSWATAQTIESQKSRPCFSTAWSAASTVREEGRSTSNTCSSCAIVSRTLACGTGDASRVWTTRENSARFWTERKPFAPVGERFELVLGPARPGGLPAPAW